MDEISVSHTGYVKMLQLPRDFVPQTPYWGFALDPTRDFRVPSPEPCLWPQQKFFKSITGGDWRMETISPGLCPCKGTPFWTSVV